jgi:hypothetical protein
LRKVHPDRWTVKKQKLFLTRLAETGSVTASPAETGMSNSGLYKLRKRSEGFCAAWDAALELGYAASFAVALSAREILPVGRIWADGNLLRGAEGDFKTATGFRLLTGSEDQALDPLMAAAEGIGTTPAYPGCAVAVFTDFQLATYGNRIPSLSFEIIADEVPVGVASILGELSGNAVSGASAALIDGLAVQGDSVRGVAETLAAALPVSLIDDGAALVLARDSDAVQVLDASDFGAGVQPGPRTVENRRAAATIPEVLSIAYYDIGRDYQAGIQRARREGGSRREDRIDLAASLPATMAKQIAETRLTRSWRERRTVSVTLPWRSIDVGPAASSASATQRACGTWCRWRSSGWPFGWNCRRTAAGQWCQRRPTPDVSWRRPIFCTASRFWR